MCITLVMGWVHAVGSLRSVGYRHFKLMQAEALW